MTAAPRRPGLAALLCCGAAAACVPAGADEPGRDPAAEVVDAERYRVSTLTDHLPDAFEALAHPGFAHVESNGTERSAAQFAAAMRACGKLGQRQTGPMVPGGGFFFASHDVEWGTVRVRFLREDVAVVTGSYSNVLGRCLDDGAGGRRVVVPTEAKPAVFTRVWVYERRRADEPGEWLMASHAATVKPSAPTAAMPVVPSR